MVGSGLKMYLYSRADLEKQFKKGKDSEIQSDLYVDNILTDFKGISERFLDCVVDEKRFNFDKIKPSELIDAWEGSLVESTNNCAEIDAANMALELAIEEGVQYLMIGTDSKYTINGATNIEAYAKVGWKRHDGKSLKNLDKWKRYHDNYLTLKSNGCVIYLTYTPGHSDNPHNDAAHINASRGVILSKLGIAERVIQRRKSDNPKSPKYNRLLNQSCWYMYSGINEQPKSKDGRWVYSCGKHGPKDEWFGKRMSDTVHSVVFLKDQDPVLEALRKRTLSYSKRY